MQIAKSTNSCKKKIHQVARSRPSGDVMFIFRTSCHASVLAIKKFMYKFGEISLFYIERAFFGAFVRPKLQFEVFVSQADDTEYIYIFFNFQTARFIVTRHVYARSLRKKLGFL